MKKKRITEYSAVW